MKPITIMLNGLPGSVAAVIAGHLLSDDRFRLIPFSLTGPEIRTDVHRVKTTDIALVRPDAPG
jgi:4-hydroxy-tetrahydrodipicolinate reductase